MTENKILEPSGARSAHIAADNLLNSKNSRIESRAANRTTIVSASAHGPNCG